VTFRAGAENGHACVLNRINARPRLSAELARLRFPWSTATPERQPQIFGDLKLFEAKAMCPIMAVRDREGP
jgi:hypothetical protein